MSAPSRSPATAASSASPVMGTLCSSNCEAKSSIASARVAAVTLSTVKDSLGRMQCLPRRVQGGAEKNEVLHQEPEGRAHGIENAWGAEEKAQGDQEHTARAEAGQTGDTRPETTGEDPESEDDLDDADDRRRGPHLENRKHPGEQRRVREERLDRLGFGLRELETSPKEEKSHQPIAKHTGTERLDLADESGHERVARRSPLGLRYISVVLHNSISLVLHCYRKVSGLGTHANLSPQVSCDRSPGHPPICPEWAQ